jgi:hypothetical protein
MTVPTPPAVSDATREAVARDLDYLYGNQQGDGAYLSDAAYLLRPTGPIASEIARLTGEREAETAVLTAECKVYRNLAEKYAAAAEAAEAETARLRAAAGDLLEMSAYLVSRHTRIQNGQPVRDLGEAAAAYVTACTSARAALSSQEKTDG